MDMDKKTIINIIKEVEELTNEEYCYFSLYADKSGAICQEDGIEIFNFIHPYHLLTNFKKWKQKKLHP